jgi:hypothetical protein
MCARWDIPTTLVWKKAGGRWRLADPWTGRFHYCLLNPDQNRKIVELYVRWGLSMCEVAYGLNLPINDVVQLLNREGVARGKVRRPASARRYRAPAGAKAGWARKLGYWLPGGGWKDWWKKESGLEVARKEGREET